MKALTWEERDAAVALALEEMGLATRAELVRRMGLDPLRIKGMRGNRVGYNAELAQFDEFLRRHGFIQEEATQHAREAAQPYPDPVEPALLVVAAKLETAAAALRLPGIDPHYKLREWRRVLQGLVDLDEALTAATAAEPVQPPEGSQERGREKPVEARHE